MTHAENAVFKDAISRAQTISTSVTVRGTVSTHRPVWRIEIPDEAGTGRDKGGSASAVVVLASIFSSDIGEVYSEMDQMANSLPQAIDPTGFRVLGVESRTRGLPDSEEAGNTVYGRQLEIELIVEPEA